MPKLDGHEIERQPIRHHTPSLTLLQVREGYNKVKY